MVRDISVDYREDYQELRMQSRRRFIGTGMKIGLGLPLWHRLSSGQAFAQAGNATNYKAIVCVELQGGNDGNNMLIPSAGPEYTQYQSLRGSLAYAQSALVPLNSGYSYPLAMNPSMVNVAGLFNAGKASFIANVGPLRSPATKAQLLADSSLVPPALLNHPAGIAQWQSASTDPAPDSGWGGRIADVMTGQSGTLPMVLTASENSMFINGLNVQGITIQGGTAPGMAAIPIALQNAELSLANLDSSSPNQIISHVAQLRIASMQQQLLLAQAKAAGSTLNTKFPTSAFGGALNTIAQLINGRSVVGATRQIFYCSQGTYDTHTNQMAYQGQYLSDLDLGLAAFMQALLEMGLADQVLICTQSEFNRTMQANELAGTDHGWGNHQLILGGGIKGGRIIGTMPDFDLGGSQDFTGIGAWIPTLAVSQMAAAVGSWIGLSSAQMTTVFPELANFPQGAITLV
jgi:uncharacterized protein (DUF1501 family)